MKKTFTFNVKNACKGTLRNDKGKMCLIGQFCHQQLDADDDELLYDTEDCYYEFEKATGISEEQVWKINDSRTSWANKVKKFRKLFADCPDYALRVVGLK